MYPCRRRGRSSNRFGLILDAFNSHIDLTISQGLGITIAGYTCEREELSGIFVKSVNEGSAAHRSGKVAVNDQIIEVDGRSIQGYTNQQGHSRSVTHRFVLPCKVPGLRVI